MVDYIVGDYKLQENDVLISKFCPDVIYKNDFNEGKFLVMFAEELKLDKEKIKFINENATADIKIITVDTKLTKGFRAKTKKYTLTKAEHDDEYNAFELVKFILTEKDRNLVLDYLLTNKPSLWMPVRVLTSNYDQMNEQNRKCTCFLDMYQWRTDRDILYHYIAFKFKPEFIRFIKWSFPKKEEK